jgi:Immunoglobulin I-set domain
MSPLAITKELEDISVQEGDSATLTVAATTDAGGSLSYAWQKDGETLTEGKAAAYVIGAAALGDAGRYMVTISDTTDTKQSSAAVTVRAAPLLWAPRFVLWSTVGLGVAFGVVLLPLWLTASSFLGNDPSLASVVALQLVVLGTVALLAGFFLAFLELRGRARTAEELLRRPTVPATPSSKSFGLGKEVAEAVPEVLKEFGKLQAPAALLIVAVALFACATAIAWRSLPDPSPAQPTQTGTTAGQTGAEPGG